MVRRLGFLVALAVAAGLGAGPVVAQQADPPPAVLALIVDDRLLTERGAVGPEDVLVGWLRDLPATRRVLLCSWQRVGCWRGAPPIGGRLSDDLRQGLESLLRRTGSRPPPPELADFDTVVESAHQGFRQHRAEISAGVSGVRPEDLDYHIAVVTQRDIQYRAIEAPNTIDQVWLSDDCFRAQATSALLQVRVPPPEATISFTLLVASDLSSADGLPHSAARYLALMAGASVNADANPKWRYRGQRHARCPTKGPAGPQAIAPLKSDGSCQSGRRSLGQSPPLDCSAGPLVGAAAGPTGNPATGAGAPGIAPAGSVQGGGHGVPQNPMRGSGSVTAPSGTPHSGPSSSQHATVIAPLVRPEPPRRPPGGPDHDSVLEVAPSLAPEGIPVGGSIAVRSAPRLAGRTEPLVVRWVETRSAFAVTPILQSPGGRQPAVAASSDQLVLTGRDAVRGRHALSLRLQPRGTCLAVPRVTGRIEVAGSMTDPEVIEVDLAVLACEGDQPAPVPIAQIELR